jgi:predicted Zn-dependent peptidase
LRRKKHGVVRNISSTTLGNGLHVITEAMSHVRSVSAGIWIDAGSRTETGAQNGIAHFIEHMVFKGTATRSAEDIARTMDSLGGHLDAFTGKELVSFNAKVLDEHLPHAMDVLADMVLRPAFRKDDIAREKGVVLEELKMEADSPEYVIHESFMSNFYKDHPLGRSILGTRETINGFTRPMIDGYWRKIYTPANIVITAAGSVDHDRFVEMVAAHFGERPAGQRRKMQAPPEPGAPRLIHQRKSVEQAQVIVGMPAYSVTHERRFAAYAMNTLLGGGMSSRLFQNIREQRGLAYNVASDISSYRDTGCLGIFAGTAKGSIPEVLRLIYAELARMKEEVVADEELVRVKNHLKGSLILGMESTSSRMSNLARQQIYFHRFPGIDETLDAIDTVTAEDMRAAARDLFQPERIGIALLGAPPHFKLDPKLLVC